MRSVGNLPRFGVLSALALIAACSSLDSVDHIEQPDPGAPRQLPTDAYRTNAEAEINLQRVVWGRGLY